MPRDNFTRPFRNLFQCNPQCPPIQRMPRRMQTSERPRIISGRRIPGRIPPARWVIGSIRTGLLPVFLPFHALRARLHQFDQLACARFRNKLDVPVDKHKTRTIVVIEYRTLGEQHFIRGALGA